jgi:proteasome lid subunit RPN8/RPN11
MDSPSEFEPDEAFAWSELISEAQISELPLREVCGGERPAIHAAAPYVLVLPSSLRRQMMEHASQGLIVPCSGNESDEHFSSEEKRKEIQEQTGILLGRVFRDPEGFLFTVITSVMPVDDAEASIAQVKLRPSSWAPIWLALHKDPEQQIVGWYHSHPGYGIFLSSTDRQTQNTYFSAIWQVAVVVDPIREELGVFSGANPEPLSCSSIVILND